jgi:endoglucanase
VAAVLALLGACGHMAGSEPEQAPAAEASAAKAVSAARAFLDRYVDPDGRVVRRDQGGDTVGEGQSYGLVLAQVAGDEPAFARIWEWTRAHLRRPDGLLAGRWSGGAVIDADSATDADLVTAWALLRADGTDPDHYHAEGRALADAVLAHETVTLPAGPVLAAGQWATGQPSTLNPSYWAVGMMRDIGARTGDPRWAEAATASVDTVRDLTDHGATLPPDWARVDDGRVTATPAPSGQVPTVRYSLDAQRVVFWLATAQPGDEVELARRWYPALSRPGRAGASALAPDGAVLDPGQAPLPLVATAAAAAAAGNAPDRDRLLDQAEALDRQHPGYYGSAWVALGRALLAGDPTTVPTPGGRR